MIIIIFRRRVFNFVSPRAPTYFVVRCEEWPVTGLGRVRGSETDRQRQTDKDAPLPSRQTGYERRRVCVCVCTTCKRRRTVVACVRVHVSAADDVRVGARSKCAQKFRRHVGVHNNHATPCLHACKRTVTRTRMRAQARIHTGSTQSHAFGFYGFSRLA